MDFLFRLMTTLALLGVLGLLAAAGLQLAQNHGAANVAGYIGLGLLASAVTLGVSVALKEIWAL